MNHQNKNLFKPNLLVQLEKKKEKQLESDDLVWTERDVKKALATFESKGKKPPDFWLKDARIEVLCKELAGSRTNGWAKMHNHAIIASLIKDTMVDKVEKKGFKMKCRHLWKS